MNNAGNITFAHADSLLKLTNTTVANRTVTLKGNLTSGVDEEGKLEINADGTNTLTLAVNAAESIGLNGANRIQELIVSGKQAVTIALNVFAQTINISSTGDVTFTAELNSGIADASSINFKAAGATAFGGNVTAETITFGAHAREISLEDGFTMTTDGITSDAGNGSQLTFIGDGTLATKAGGAGAYALDAIVLADNAKTVTLEAGDYTVGNIELIHALGTVELADGFKLTGAFNNGGGLAGEINFLGDAKVTGVLGGAVNSVGIVTVAGVDKTLQLGGKVHATSLDADVANKQNLKFINAAAINVDTAVGKGNPFEQIEFAGAGKVTFIGPGDLTNPVANLHFSAKYRSCY